MLTTIFTVGSWFAAVHSLGESETADLLWRFEFNLILAWWVHDDRRVRGFRVPYEFDAFVFFAWPIIVPYYLYRTRRGRGLLLVTGIFGLHMMPYVIAQIARITYVR